MSDANLIDLWFAWKTYQDEIEVAKIGPMLVRHCPMIKGDG